MDYDVFICHASEDKKEFVEPLASSLKQKGLKVWYDHFELKLGDSLRRKIDEGLSNSKYGVVVLSESFFKKEWPQEELDALVGKENEERRKVILPIWHKIGVEKVRKFSPILASKLAVRSDVGIENIVLQITEVCKEEANTEQIELFKKSTDITLRERCLSIIRKGDKIAWRKILKEVANPISQQLIDWKNNKGNTAHEGREAWAEAVYKAVEICIPAFIPIFVSVETGKREFWSETFFILRKLAMQEDEMGAGPTWALGIGASMLYIAGSLGMALAVETKQTKFIEQWTTLPMPNPESSRHEEIPWISVLSANRLPEGYEPQNKEPFSFLLQVCESDQLSDIFPNREQLIECFFLSNLLQSLIELRECTAQEKSIVILEKEEWQYFHLEVWPLWCFMKSKDFQKSTWEIFGSSEGVYRFLFPNGGVPPRRFWAWWKKWKKLCVTKLDLSSRRFLLLRPEWLILPGEPSNE